jgi:mannose-1-phosphate guanylyltransferase
MGSSIWRVISRPAKQRKAVGTNENNFEIIRAGSKLCRGRGSDGTGGMMDFSTLTTCNSRHLWAVLLAGGEGIRLRDLTVRIVGDHRPKQYCPIVGTESLLSQTRARLDPLFSGDRQVFVVSRAHERYYSKELADAKDSIVIAQPMNRGTAVGIIAALVQIMQADPDAIVGFFPCDHHYSDDQSFRSIVRLATSSAEQFSGSVIIVGAEAEYAETDYGWIEPGLAVSGLAVSETQAKPLCRVNRFWEKPALPQAQALLQSGCLWNTFVTIGSAATLLELVCSEVPDVVLSVTRSLADNDLARTYARLPNVDFSGDILTNQAKRLLVLRDSGSGWADLGSPDRVLRLLSKNVNQPAWFRQSDRTSEFHELREVV